MGISPTDTKELETRFTYHAPKGNEPYDVIRSTAKSLAHVILDNVPESREKSLAMTKLEEAVMWANAAVARRS